MKTFSRFTTRWLLFAAALISLNVHAALTDISNAPLATSSGSSVKPNLMYVLDNSGSMAWDYMPDNVDYPYFSTSKYGFASAQCNGVYYDPTQTYALPVYASGLAYPASSFTLAPIDGFGTTTTSTMNLNNNFYLDTNNIDGSFASPTTPGMAYYYNYTGTQTTQAQKTILVSSSTYFKECNSSIGSSPGNAVFTKVRLSTTETTTVTISGTSSTSVSGITVNGVQIMSGSAAASTSSSTLATNIAAKISLGGFSATASGSTVTITGPTSAANYIPLIPQSGSMTLTTDVFPDTNATHLQNFANWYSYYRTRILMMKSAAGLVFKNIDNGYRVGFTAISYTGVDSTNPLFLQIADFDSPQKTTWYSKFYAIAPTGATPLRVALAKAGRMYAGQLLTGANDPVQYSCQQNFAILSTDGYWNDSTNPTQINGTTAVGEQDALEVRPMYDGAGISYGRSTSQIRESQAHITQDTTQTQKRTTQMQQRTQQLQQQTTVTQKVQAQLYKRTSSNSGNSWSDWVAVSTCTEDSSGSSRTQCIVGTLQKSTSSDHGSTWSAWANTSSCTTDSSGSSQTRCQVVQNWVTAASCTPTHTGSSGSYAWTGDASAVACQSSSSWTNVATCSGTCQTTDTGWVNATACTASSSGGQTVTCQTTDTGWVGASSCTPSSSGGQTVTCQTADSGWLPVASCTPQTANSGNGWTTIACNTTIVMPPTPVASCTAAAPGAGNNYTSTTCTTVTTGPTTTGSCTAAAPTASNNWTTTTCSAPTITGGTANTLADVAEYYWKTDLRTPALGNCTGALGIDVCQNDVPGTAPDINAQQHMTTFTLGLGADGTLEYTPDYLSGGSADYTAIKNGTLDWPNPLPAQDATRIDDLWHAAVDGRGVYYSAKSAASLVSGLSNALAGVTARAGSSSAAATSSLEPVSGDNFLFIAQFRTVFWDGDLEAKTIDTSTGNISAALWSAQALLDTRASASSDTRTIYTFDSSGSNNLIPFQWASLNSSEQAYFNNICSPTDLLSQCPTLSASDQAAASGQNLVNYLRGQSQYAGTLYRSREHILGDMVDSQPQYVKAPPYNYVDAGYSDFQSAQSGRTAEVYVGANDGMLHAFDANSGQETWAYIPAMVLSNMYHLADDTYSANHHYYVDGSPVAGDVCPSAPSSGCSGTTWKTILVGGLNAGGRGYYALDITDPANPKALWNFTSANDSDLGYTFGNPVIAKRKDGTWVVAVASGYNNVSPGSGQGFVFVLNAYTGQLLEKIGTGVGSTSSPSGLSKINPWINVSTDKTAERFYGGDLLGELWRITLDSGTPPAPPVSTAGTAFMLAQVGQTNGAGNQPITTKPELTTVTYAGTNYNVVEFGTGEYLGLTDLTDTSLQSVYAIEDNLGTTSLGLVRTPGILVQQVLTDTTGTNGVEARTVTNNPVDWSTKDGWFVDLDPSNTSPGERVNIDVQLNLGMLTVATNVPSGNACDAGGYAFLYYFDFTSGAAPSTAINNEVGEKDSENAMVAGMNFVFVQTATGVQGLNILCTTDASCHTTVPPPAPPLSGGVNRFSWRELVQ